MRFGIFICIFIFIVACNAQLSRNTNTFTSSKSIAMGGAGFLLPSSISLKINPAMNHLDRQFITSIVKYPASISSQSIGFNFPLEKFHFSPSLKYISYGIFQEYDEDANFLGNYHSYETWVGSSFSKKIINFPIFIGANLNWHRSFFNGFKINSLSVDIGTKIFFKNINNAIGLSFHQIGIGLKNKKPMQLIPEIVISGSKKLRYLPAVIYIDLLINNFINENEMFLGSLFEINKKLNLMLGTSSRKFDQNTSEKLSKSILGATGFGVLYMINNINVQYGIYLYGNGAQIQALDIGMKF